MLVAKVVPSPYNAMAKRISSGSARSLARKAEGKRPKKEVSHPRGRVAKKKAVDSCGGSTA
jgi:hypothetical protein